MPCDRRVGNVERLAFDQCSERGAGFAAQARLFLLEVLGLDAFVLSFCARIA